MYDNIIFRNLVFYVCFACAIALVNFSGVRELFHENPFYLIEFAGLYSLTYLLCFFHNKFLFKRYLDTKKYYTYITLLAASVFFWTMALELTNPFTLENWLNTFVGGFLVVFFGFGFYMIFQFVFLAQWKLKTSLSNTQYELAQLRAQLNPHFLFNALNNLYGVSLRDPEKVTGYIFMLSGLLRYQVEGSKKERVDLSDELRFIEQFVAYEKLKLGHRGDIKLQIDVVDSSLVIAPLILFQFIENAFKFSGLKVQPRVLIQIFLRDNKIYFECTNSFDKELREKSDGTRTSMINVCQRLELQYPLQHSLRINESEQEYNVQLEIELTDGKI